MSSTPFIELSDIEKIFCQGDLETKVLKGIHLTIVEGEFVAIMGASGSGKTTLMNLIGCLDQPTTGTYFLNGEDVSLLSRDKLAAIRSRFFGFIFQRYHLISGLSALENVEIPAIYSGIKKAQRHKEANELLSTLGIGDRVNYKPSQLSGGQQQRVSIARALMNGGKAILADEPTGALDSKSGVEVMKILHQLHKDGHTIIMVTHDREIAKNAERIIEVSDGIIISDTQVNPRSTPLQKIDLSKPENKSGLADVGEALKMAVRSLKSNSFRAFLTMLGIIIGVGSVVAMLAIGNGAKKQVLDRIEAMGTNLLLIKTGAPNVRGGGTIATLTPEDAKAVSNLTGVLSAIPEILLPITAQYNNRSYITSIDGTSENFSKARDWPTKRGVFFTKKDIQSYAQVAVLGKTVVDNLFPDGANPVGQYILLKNVPFQVIGVMQTKGADPSGNDLDAMIWIPITTSYIRLTGVKYLKSISVKVADANMMNQLQENINELLLKRHSGVQDFDVRNMASLIATANQSQDTLTYLLSAIAAISLLVGGIGVMNIMLVSVTERTKEIGIRMAVGAKTSDVLSQFLTESVVISLIGGMIGILVGFAGGWITALTTGWLAIFTPGPVIIAFAFAFFTGLIFGYLPARRAAMLNPVIALSTE